MTTSLDNENNATYYIDDIKLNDFIGKNITIEFLNEINCVSCGNKTKKAIPKGIALCACVDCQSAIFV